MTQLMTVVIVKNASKNLDWKKNWRRIVMRKSGNVTIRLGPKEVENLISGRNDHGTNRKVMDKLRDMVTKEFPGVIVIERGKESRRLVKEKSNLEKEQ